MKFSNVITYTYIAKVKRNTSINFKTNDVIDVEQVRDGIGPYSSLIGRYCGTTIPDPITSTTNFLWIKFFSDSTTERRGFEASVVNVDPICGSQIALNVTTDAQVSL
jgi:hypothetical protein